MIVYVILIVLLLARFYKKDLDSLNGTDSRSSHILTLQRKYVLKSMLLFGVSSMEEKLIAPCGMNCGVCVGYLALQNDLNKKGFKRRYCLGCLPRGKNCVFMKQHCDLVGKGLVRFCYECQNFPCRRLKALDKRYRTKYHMSMIENLIYIRDKGIDKFLEKEREKWQCHDCNGVICCHNGLCLNCNLDKLIQKKTYRWGET
jgi:hypothetical protein